MVRKFVFSQVQRGRKIPIKPNSNRDASTSLRKKVNNAKLAVGGLVVSAEVGPVLSCSLEGATARCIGENDTSVMVTTAPKSRVGNLQHRTEIAPRSSASERVCFSLVSSPPLSRGDVRRVLLRNHCSAVRVVVVVVFVLWFLCFRKLGVMTVFKPIQIASVEKLKRKRTVKVIAAVVVMGEVRCPAL